MALTFAKVGDWRLSLGGPNGTVWDLTPAASDYPAKGYPVTGRQFGLSNNLIGIQILSFLRRNQAQPGAALVMLHDVTAGTLRVYGMNAVAGAGNPFTEVAAATDLSAYTARIIAIGY